MKIYLYLFALLFLAISFNSCSESSTEPSEEKWMIPLVYGDVWELVVTDKVTQKSQVYKKKNEGQSQRTWEIGYQNTKIMTTFSIAQFTDNVKTGYIYYTREGSKTYLGEANSEGKIYPKFTIDDSGKMGKDNGNTMYQMTKRNWKFRTDGIGIILPGTDKEVWYISLDGTDYYYQNGIGCVGTEDLRTRSVLHYYSRAK